MSKPLELTIYPPLSSMVRAGMDHNIEQGLYPYLGFNAEIHVPGIIRMHIKRLTDTELAAEYWRADGGSHITAEYSALEGWFNDGGEEYLSWDAADHWRQTVHRFATSPHYFEADQ